MNLDQLIKEYREIDKYFDQTFPQLKGEYKILARLGKITEELGELNSAVHGELGLHRPAKQLNHNTDHLQQEWADVFNTLMLFGLVLNLDIPKVIADRLDHIFTRLNLEPVPRPPTGPRFFVGVICALYNNQGKILMAKRSLTKSHAAGVWEPISGGVEAGEQPIEALKRELREELGSQIQYEIGPIYNTFQTRLDNGKDIVGISFLCQFLGGEIQLNHEHSEFRWMSIDEAIELTTTQGLKDEFSILKSNYPNLFPQLHNSI